MMRDILFVSDAIVALCGCAFLSSHQEEVNPLIPHAVDSPLLKKRNKNFLMTRQNQFFEKKKRITKRPSLRDDSLIIWVTFDISEY